MRIVLVLICSSLLFSVPALGQDKMLDDEAWLGSLLSAEDLIFDVEKEALSEELDTSEWFGEVGVLPVWSTDLNLTLGGGWKDNALLSETTQASSGFAQVEADFFALRPRGEGRVEFLGLVYSEYRYYDDVPGLDVESLSIAQVNVDYEVRDGLILGAVFEGLYTEQAFDASEQEFEPSAVTVTVWRPQLGVGVEKRVSGLGTFELEANYGNVRYGQESEDYDLFERSFVWSKNWGEQHVLQLSVGRVEENYAERMERASVGSLGEDALLHLDVERWQADWKWVFGQGVLNSWSTKVLYEEEDDKLGDYYERARFQFGQRLNMTLGAWDLDLSLAHTMLDYRHRRHAVFAEERREDSGWSWRIEATRGLGLRYNWLIRFDGADKKSNSDGLSYEGNTVFLGLQIHGSGGT